MGDIQGLKDKNKVVMPLNRYNKANIVRNGGRYCLVIDQQVASAVRGSTGRHNNPQFYQMRMIMDKPGQTLQVK